MVTGTGRGFGLTASLLIKWTTTTAVNIQFPRKVNVTVADSIDLGSKLAQQFEFVLYATNSD